MTTRFVAVSLLLFVGAAFNTAVANSSLGGIPSVSRFVDPDGYLIVPDGYSGHVDPFGFRLTSGPGERPRFSSSDDDEENSRWKTGFEVPNGCSDEVLAIAIGKSGEVFMGGSFSACGDTVAHHVVRYHPETDSWSTLGSDGGNGVDGPVHALLVVGDDLYVGGRFASANVGNDVAANNVARWDGTSWSSLGSGAGNGVDGRIAALAEFQGGIVAGGDFGRANAGQPVVAHNIAQWRNGAWQALGHAGGNGVGGQVHALGEHEAFLYVGGYFQLVNWGHDVESHGIARWSGKEWSSVAGTAALTTTAHISAIASHQGTLYVGGGFHQPVGNGGMAYNIMRRSGDSWIALGDATGNGVNGEVGVLLSHGERLLVGGDFSAVNVASDFQGQAANGLAVWDGVGWEVPSGLSGLETDGVTALSAAGGGIYLGMRLTGRIGWDDKPHAYVTRLEDGVETALGRTEGLGVGGVVNAMLFSDGELYLAGELFTLSPHSARYVVRWDGASWQELAPLGMV